MMANELGYVPDDAHRKPICPVCKASMELARKVKGFFALPELHTFECRGCAVISTVALPQTDSRRREESSDVPVTLGHPSSQ